MGEVLIFPAMIVGLAFWPAIFFWALVAVLFVELCFDHGTAALVTLVVAVAASFFLGFWTLEFVYQHQRAFLWLAAFYVPLGVLWAFIRWPLFLLNMRSKVRKYLADEEHGIRTTPRITQTEIDKKMRNVRDSLSHRFEELPPRVTNHKSDLMRWMGWWPISVVTYVLGDLIRHLFTAIYEGFANMWQAMSNRIFQGVDFRNPPESVIEGDGLEPRRASR